ncbi:hypothetical protein KP509_31G041100 [Ceratopteris richardii]|uniref:Uncharacterized protein n=1 Tax=Ceratopteris richardii TaxID=49495 RepID=A0A8T2QXD8_CERRI|nr:hypothetical protein KP509_31G041100 [Ceratopteris richardii]
MKIFNYFYAAISISTLLASTLLAYIEKEGKWAMAFWISTGGNALCRIGEVVRVVFRRRHIKIPLEGNQLYELFRCLEKPAAITKIDFDNVNNQIRRNSWHLCTGAPRVSHNGLFDYRFMCFSI